MLRDGLVRGPPDIVYGRHICLECGMIISEERVAAAYEWEGEDRVFDDIGDMLIHGKDAGEPGCLHPGMGPRLRHCRLDRRRYSLVRVRRRHRHPDGPRIIAFASYRSRGVRLPPGVSQDMG